MRLAALTLLALLALGVAAGCPSVPNAANERDVDALAVVADEGITVRFLEGDLPAVEARKAARVFAVVRRAVAEELALVGSSSEGGALHAEVILYHDESWGQERWHVTRAKILERPLRVRIPCGLPVDESDGERIAARLRGTIAHEITESTVVTRVPIVDPYLRWLHDGIAESVEHRVLKRLDPRTAAADVERYAQYALEAQRSGIRWLDLLRWRQLPDWIVHSDVLFEDHRPLRLDDYPGALRRLSQLRLLVQENHPGSLATLDGLLDLVGESWAKEALPPARDEADPRKPSLQFLWYDASFCFWLELERAHPGVTARVVAEIGRWRREILRNDDVIRMIDAATGEHVRPRLERFSLDRLNAVLAAEARVD